MMRAIVRIVNEQWTAAINGWDTFWFSPRSIDTVAVLRILTGAMLLYSHLVLLSDYSSFVGTTAWIDNGTAAALHDGTLGEPTAARSYLWNIESTTLLTLHHVLTISVTASMMIGLLTRITAPLAVFLQLMILHRLMGALFGFDQIVTYAAMYVAIAPSGSRYSIDAWIRDRNTSQNRPMSGWRNWLFPPACPTISANIATRLLQLHLCVIYLFGGLAKARGEMWWDGTALWFAVSNYEYQSVDLTFLAAYPKCFTALTHVTLFWEIFYCALVWPAATRPFVLMIAVAVHAGIALFLGMMTFGLMMIFANMIFVSPSIVRRAVVFVLGIIGGDTRRTSAA